MSILIKNMERPAGCFHCRFMTKCGMCKGLSDSCILSDDAPSYDHPEKIHLNRPAWCPLVEIPEKHRADDKMLEEAGLSCNRKTFVYTSTLCWTCRNAVPNPETGAGCPWSEKQTPVDGWRAEETVVISRAGGYTYSSSSFLVVDCPLFAEG